MADNPGKSRASRSEDNIVPDLESTSFSPILETDEGASSPETTRRRARAVGTGYGNAIFSSFTTFSSSLEHFLCGLSTDACATIGTINNADQTPTQSQEDLSLSQSDYFQNARIAPSGSQSDKTKKPTAIRRMSSKRPTPYRGQEFSVDDDPYEVERDNALQQASNPPQPSPRIKPLSGKNSTLRRRTNAPPSSLSRNASSKNDEDTFTLPEAGPSTLPETSPQDQDDNDDEDATSDAESFTLRDRQEAINETHPFGIKIGRAHV